MPHSHRHLPCTASAAFRTLVVVLLPVLVLACAGTTPSPAATRVPTARPTSVPTVALPTATPAPAATPRTSVLGQERVTGRVTHVVDGDAVEVAIGSSIYTVRYIGTDSTEVADPRNPIKLLPQEAANKNGELVDGKLVVLEKDVSETDAQGRLLAYVYVDNLFVNAELVRLGLALASIDKPDVKYQDLFQKAEREAREARRGIWAGFAPTATPRAVAAGATPAATKTALPATAGTAGCAAAAASQTPPSPDCAIKGKITAQGERLYYTPLSLGYAGLTVDPKAGERWFRTEDEANAAGWRKSVP